TAVVSNVGRFTGPRGNGTQPREYAQYERFAIGLLLHWRAVFKQPAQPLLFGFIERALHPNIVLVLPGNIGHGQAKVREAFEQLFAPESGKDGRSGKMQNGVHCIWKGRQWMV